MADDERLLYCRPDFLNIDWKIKQGANGCTILDADEFHLRTDKAAPALPKPPSAPELPNAFPKPSKSLIERFGAFQAWLNEPPPPKPTIPPSAIEAPKRPKVKPFDIQDIAYAMELMNWPRSAKLMRKWFAGELNVTTPEGEKDAVNQKGEPFPPSMVDTTMFPLSWILGFPRAKARYDKLINQWLYTPSARKVLVSILSRPELRSYVPSAGLKSLSYRLNAWETCGRDLQLLHRNYQFQRHSVDSQLLDRAILGARSLFWPRSFPDDLYGALGTFRLFASRVHCSFSIGALHRRRR